MTLHLLPPSICSYSLLITHSIPILSAPSKQFEKDRAKSPVVRFLQQARYSSFVGGVRLLEVLWVASLCHGVVQLCPTQTSTTTSTLLWYIRWSTSATQLSLTMSHAAQYSLRVSPALPWTTIGNKSALCLQSHTENISVEKHSHTALERTNSWIGQTDQIDLRTNKRTDEPLDYSQGTTPAFYSLLFTLCSLFSHTNTDNSKISEIKCLTLLVTCHRLGSDYLFIELKFQTRTEE